MLTELIPTGTKSKQLVNTDLRKTEIIEPHDTLCDLCSSQALLIHTP